jgi:hypothetical protein
MKISDVDRWGLFHYVHLFPIETLPPVKDVVGEDKIQRPPIESLSQDRARNNTISTTSVATGIVRWSTLIVRSSSPLWTSVYRASHWTQGLPVQTRRGRTILRSINIRSTTSFGGEVKPSAKYRKNLRHVKDPYKVWVEVPHRQNSAISRQVSPALLGVCSSYCQRALMNEFRIDWN